MDILILRLIHVLFGAFWLGAVFTNVLFLQPTAAALGPDAARFQLRLLGDARFPAAILGAAAITVVAGLVLLWIGSNGLDPDHLFGTPGLGFTVGGLIGVLTFAFGSTYVYPRTQRIGRVLGGIMAEGRPPTPEEGAQLGQLRGELKTAGWATVVGLAITVIAMATARYWGVIL